MSTELAQNILSLTERGLELASGQVTPIVNTMLLIIVLYMSLHHNNIFNKVKLLLSKI